MHLKRSMLVALGIAGATTGLGPPVNAAPAAGHQADSLDAVGVYRFPDGRLVGVRGLEEGRLRYIDFGTGEAHTMHPAGRDEYRSAADWSSATPVALRYRLIRGAAGDVRRLELRGAAGTLRRAERVRLPSRPANFTNGGVRLHGRLILPETGAGPHAAVVYVQGSDTTAAVSREVLPYYWAANGVAAFVYDKRGTGRTEGAYTQQFSVLAADLAAAVGWLEAQASEVDARRIGAAGFSQGGWVAPLAAAMEPAISFVFVGYGLAMTVAEEDRLEAPLKLRALGFEGDAIAELQELNAVLHTVARAGFPEEGWSHLEAKLAEYRDRPWLEAFTGTQTWTGTLLAMGLEQARQVVPQLFTSFIEPFYDPVPTLESLDIPMMWMIAADDIEAPPGPTIDVLTRLRDDGAPITLVVVPDTDHGLTTFTIGPAGERIRTGYAEHYFRTMMDWLAEHAARDGAERDHVDLAIIDARVIAMTSDTVLSDMTVLARDGRIVRVGPSGDVTVPAGARRIAAEGAYLLPGLHDMHVHLPSEAVVRGFGLEPPPKGVRHQAALLPYLANGITTVQVMSGSPDLLRLRDEVAAGRIAGPRMIVGSPMLDGRPPILPEPITRVVATPAEAASVVQEYYDAGYDFLKLRSGLSRAVFDAVAAHAASAGMPLIGHVPEGDSLGLDYVLGTIGYGVAHLEEFPSGGRGQSDHDLDAYVRRALETGAGVITTLTVHADILDQIADPAAALADPAAAYVPDYLRATFWRGGVASQDTTARRAAALRRQLEFLQRLAHRLHDAGVPTMVGTDALVPTIVPGFDFHRELRLLAESGLEPFDVLRMATTVPASRLSNSPRAGTIAAGEPAHLVLLDRNPLADLDALSAVRGVVAAGRWLDRDDLAARLVAVEQAYRGPNR